MKKKIFSIICVAVFTVVIVFNINISMNSNAEMDITLANVEALGDKEIDCSVAFPLCSTHCPYEWCGYCLGQYLLQCEYP